MAEINDLPTTLLFLEDNCELAWWNRDDAWEYWNQNSASPEFVDQIIESFGTLQEIPEMKILYQIFRDDKRTKVWKRFFEICQQFDHHLSLRDLEVIPASALGELPVNLKYFLLMRLKSIPTSLSAHFSGQRKRLKKLIDCLTD